MRKRRLRSGYTTGTCAAAATKAALWALLKGEKLSQVEVTLPGGSRVRLPVHRVEIREKEASAAVIKDAGDDPDITNGVEIVATVRWGSRGGEIQLKGGPGVGRVTKPGLPVPVGEPAINPVPRQMIREAVKEVLGDQNLGLEVTFSIPKGEALAQKTLNPRLGIVGGLSILGTSGIVKPLSSEAWLATIEASLRVAQAVGLEEVVLSFGRASELAHMRHYRLPEEAYVLMGDFVEFALRAVDRLGFPRVQLAGQWAKLLKCAMVADNPPIVQEDYGFTTHVRHGVVNPSEALAFLKAEGLAIPEKTPVFNTARELFEWLLGLPPKVPQDLFRKVLFRVQSLAARWAPKTETKVVLISYRREVVFEL